MSVIRGIHLALREVNDFSASSERYCRESGVDVELVQDALDVGADGVRRDVQQKTNLGAGQSLDQAAQHIELPRREERDGFGLRYGRPISLRERGRALGQFSGRLVCLASCRSPGRGGQ